MLRRNRWILSLLLVCLAFGGFLDASEEDPASSGVDNTSRSSEQSGTDSEDASCQSTTAGATSTETVTVLGLGKMGTAVVQCLVASSSSSSTEDGDEQQQRQVQVHAWNRGAAKRRAVSDIATVHETAQEAVNHSNTTLILIDDWPGTVQLLRELSWRDDQTVVVFSTYTPTDIQSVQRELFVSNNNNNNGDKSTKPTLIGGAIVGVPQTICSPQALILTSADVPLLHTVGRTVAFAGSDVGLAALANMALILVITFGVAGQELALLMVRQYHENDDDANDAQQQHDFLDLYVPLAAEIGPAYTKMLLPAVSKAMRTGDYERSYVPVGVFRKVLHMHATFLQHLGVAEDTFLASYLQYLDRIVNEKHGPAAWTELAIVEKTVTTTTKVDDGDGDSMDGNAPENEL